MFFFSKIKSHLKKKTRFQDVKNIQEDATRQLLAIPKKEFHECFHQGKRHWIKSVTSEWNYFEVVKMLLVVVCLFVICWMPLQTYNLLSEVYSPINDYEYINIIWFCFNWLAMSNSCYNPFIYGLLNEKFKREFRQLCNVCFCRKEKRDLIGPDFSDDSVQPIRKYSVNENAHWNRTNFDNNRSKRYIRVQTEYTEQSMV